MLHPRIENIKEKRLIGKRISMSLVEDKTSALWKSFMPLRKQIKHVISPDLYGIRVYDAPNFENFNSKTIFDKWAAIEVSDFEEITESLEPFLLKGGKYAIFIHKGSSEDHRIYSYIYGEWIPQSEYQIGHRPHFDILSDK
jgi:AraC family transcriptional regulator